jgi:hypothetical protein
MNAVTSPALFDAQLMRETLLSERLRATIPASVAAVIGLTLFLLSRLDASEFLTALRQTKTDYPMLGLVGSLVLYELGLRYMLGRLIHNHRRAPLPLRYVNACLEVTMPAIAILLFAQRVEPLYALVSVAPFAYFLFIVLATLRLEFWLCVFTGGLAATQYIIFFWHYISQEFLDHIHPMLRAQAYYGLKGFLMLLAGLAARFVTVQVKQRIVRSLQRAAPTMSRAVQARRRMATGSVGLGCGLPPRLTARCGLGGAAHPENPAAFRDGRGHRPGEHLRSTLVQTLRTELVKRGTAGIRYQDFRHTHSDPVAHQLV